MSTTARLISDNLPIDPTIFKGFGTGSQGNFTIIGSTGLTNPANLIVSLDGVVQEPNTDYSVNGNTVTFTTAPAQGVKVVIVYRNAPYSTDSVTPTTGSVNSNAIAAGAVIPSKLSTGGPSWDTDGQLTITKNAGASNATFAGGKTLLRLQSSGAWSEPRIDFAEGSLIPTAFIASKNSGNGGGSLIFGNRDTTSQTSLSSEKMRIGPTGNVGIGIINPTQKLHVSEGNILLERSTTNPSVTISSSNSPAVNTWSFSELRLINTRTHGRTFAIQSITDGNPDSAGLLFQNTSDPNLSHAASFWPAASGWYFDENDIHLCPNVLRGFVSFYGGSDFTFKNAAAGNALNPQFTTRGGTWTVPTNGAPGGGYTSSAGSSPLVWTDEAHLGVEYWITVGNSFANPLGGRLPTNQRKWDSVNQQYELGNRRLQRYGPGIGIRIVEIQSPTVARWEYIDPRLTAANSVQVNGTGNTDGFTHFSCGIKGGYNVTAIGRSSAGKYIIYFANAYRHPTTTYANLGHRQNSLVISGTVRSALGSVAAAENNNAFICLISRTAASSAGWSGASNPIQSAVNIGVFGSDGIAYDNLNVNLMWAIERE